MNSTIASGFREYRVGAIVPGRDGSTWQIVECHHRTTPRGYQSRLFTLSDESGRRIRKTSRGITLLSAGREVRFLDRPQQSPAAAKPAVVDDRPLASPPAGEVRHANFEALLRAIAAGCHVWLVGPAGGGKTSAVEQVAAALGVQPYAKSVGPQTSESSLLGYHDANGRVVRTQLRDWYEHGGVFLLDEIDSASPASLLVINALLGNSFASFPDRIVHRHTQAYLIAGANTIGQGADRQYVGRQQIDAATLDRFINLTWDYDPRIEAAIAGVPIEALSEADEPSAIRFEAGASAEDRERNCVAYVRYVVSVRNAVKAHGRAIRFLVGPRASKHGCALIRQGFSVSDAAEAALWKGIDSDTRNKIQSTL